MKKWENIHKRNKIRETGPGQVYLVRGAQKFGEVAEVNPVAERDIRTSPPRLQIIRRSRDMVPPRPSHRTTRFLPSRVICSQHVSRNPQSARRRAARENTV